MIMEHVHEKTLLSLMQNENAMQSFEENYFPPFEIMDNNEIYIHTNRFVYSITGSHHEKFFVFDSNGKLLTDPAYNYTLFPSDGYIMKINIISVSNITYNIIYFIKVDDLQVREDVNPGTTFKENPLDIKPVFTFKSIDYKTIVKREFLMAMQDQKKFFEDYLNFDL